MSQRPGSQMDAELSPGTQEWDDHFHRWSGWHIVRVTPNVKKIHELLSRFSTKTCFLLAPGTYYGPIVLRGSSSCLVLGDSPNGDSVTIECESDLYPTLTVDAPNSAVQFQNLKIVSKSNTPALLLKQGQTQIVGCSVGSLGGDALSISTPAALRQCRVSASVASTTVTQGPASKSIGVSISSRSQPVNVNLTETLIEGFDTGIMLDRLVRYRIDDSLIQGMGVVGVLAGGSTSGTIRNTSLQNNLGHGLVVEAEARSLIYQCTLTGNGKCGALLCDASQPSIIECLVEANKGVRQIDLYGSTVATLKENTVVLHPTEADQEGGRTFSLGVAMNDVSDALVESNTFRLIRPGDASDESDSEQNQQVTSLFDRGIAGIVADGSSTSVIRGNRFKVINGNNPGSSASDKSLSEGSYGIMLGLWQAARVDSNTFEGFRGDMAIYKFDTSASTDPDSLDRPAQVSTWKTRTKRSTNKKAQPSQVASSMPTSATPDMTSSVAVKLSSRYRDSHPGTPDPQGLERPPSAPMNRPQSQASRHSGRTSRPVSAKGGRASALGGSERDYDLIPVLKDHEDEVKELKGEIERLKACLRLKSHDSNQNGEGKKRRPQSARPYRPSSRSTSRQGPHPPRGREVPSRNSARTSSTNKGPSRPASASSSGRNMKVVGRYTWDMDRMNDFNKMRIPLSEVRTELMRPGTADGDERPPTSASNRAASIASRLHDNWIQDKKQREQELAAAEAMSKGMAKKLEVDQQKRQVTHLHDDQVKRFEEGREEREKKYHPKIKQRRLTGQQQAAFCTRIFTKHEEYKKELKDTLYKKHVVQNDHRKYKKFPQTAIDAYSKSLHKSHRNANLVEKASAEMGVPLNTVKDRPPVPVPPPKPSPLDGYTPRPPPAPRSKKEIEKYCASLHAGHKDATLAEVADRAVEEGDAAVLSGAEEAHHSGRRLRVKLTAVATKAQRRSTEDPSS